MPEAVGGTKMSVGKPEAMGVAEGKARVAEVTEASGKAEISKAGKVVTGAEGDETTEGMAVGEAKCGGDAAAMTIVGKAGTATGGATEGMRGEAKAEAGRTEDSGAMVMGIDVVAEASEAEMAAGGAGAGAGAIGVGGVMTEVDKTEVAVMTTVGDREMVVEAGDCDGGQSWEW
ncbi:hypothetical protein F5148DRAFT_1150034 [Russula earlei]|uniref:Uncharacterized protein n=1 Tax=Russula earlei TaxID=71964 RepID=A0ACC0U5X6_9AGAM|nr:hypothetical protein F5148DRAFT_1150034 [Russula earlei]